MFDALVETEVLAAHLRDPKWVIFDCRSVLTDPKAGPARYTESHIPGARYLHLEQDLSGPVTSVTGRHPLPLPEVLTEKLGHAGVGKGTQVVAYDDAGGAYAARLWWLLRWLGHAPVAVLNGGWQQWLKEDRPVTAEVPRPEPRNLRSRAGDRHAWLSSEEIADLVAGRRSGLLVDARAPARYRGAEEPIDPVAGHIPGAINLPFADNLAADGRFKCPMDLRQRFDAALDGRPAAEVVAMCGSGVTACHNLLAMEVAGLKGGRLYAGSWSEWIRDAARPVERSGSESSQ